MAGSRLGFDRNQIELHQVLGVRLAPDGTSGMPLRPDWEQPRGDGRLLTTERPRFPPSSPGCSPSPSARRADLRVTGFNVAVNRRNGRGHRMDPGTGASGDAASRSAAADSPGLLNSSPSRQRSVPAS
jgi:hypothetical protein